MADKDDYESLYDLIPSGLLGDKSEEEQRLIGEMLQRYSQSYGSGASREAWINRLALQDEEMLAAIEEGIPVSQSVLESTDYTPAPYLEYQTPIDHIPYTPPLGDAAEEYYDERIAPVVLSAIQKTPIDVGWTQGQTISPRESAYRDVVRYAGKEWLSRKPGDAYGIYGPSLKSFTSGRSGLRGSELGGEEQFGVVLGHEMGHVMDNVITTDLPYPSKHSRMAGERHWPESRTLDNTPPALSRGIAQMAGPGRLDLEGTPGGFRQKEWWHTNPDLEGGISEMVSGGDPSAAGEAWNYDRLHRVFPWLADTPPSIKGEHWAQPWEIYANIIDLRTRAGGTMSQTNEGFGARLSPGNVKNMIKGRADGSGYFLSISDETIPAEVTEDLRRALRHSLKEWRKRYRDYEGSEEKLDEMFYQMASDNLNEISAVDLPAPDTPDTRGLA